MASVFRRRDSKGKRRARWSYKYRGADGRWYQGTGTTDKQGTLDIARKLESEAAQIVAGVIEPGERVRREAALAPLADHIEGYRLEILARGGTAKHARHVAGVLTRLLAAAAVDSISRLASDRIQAALGRLAAKRSARTANHARAAVLAFLRWLVDNGRLRELPTGLRKLRAYNEEADRRRVRRALSTAELDRLLAAAEAGPTIEAYRGPRGRLQVAGSLAFLSGPERAFLYRLAMGTGFRADELRSLTPECFALDGEGPTITCRASYTKNGKEAVQPITRDLAAQLRPFLAGKPSGKPVVPVPVRTARMLRADLAAADIPYADEHGRVVDFHALRGSYITALIRSGANPRVVQKLARHSTVTLTLERYTHLDEGDLRKALEGDGTTNAPRGSPDTA